MNKTPKIILSGLIVVVICLCLTVGAIWIKVSKSAFGGQSTATARWSDIGSSGISSSTKLTTSSMQMIATSSAREYAEITNLSAYAIYCNADADKPAVLYKGLMIAASSTRVFGQDFAYNGAIQCIAPAANSSTTSYARQ